MRGARSSGVMPQALQRIIPADAGSTCQLPDGYKQMGDHPRGCGEHLARQNARCRLGGSSPRMRGARDSPGARTARMGIIPADAGSTMRAVFKVWLNRDHPRGCGEHVSDSDITLHESGSSPRMRGALDDRQTLIGCRGIIPADAGSTSRPATYDPDT